MIRRTLSCEGAMQPDSPELVGRIVRAARMLLAWGQGRLACEAGISIATVHLIEHGRVSTKARSLIAVCETLEAHGISFATCPAAALLSLRLAALDEQATSSADTMVAPLPDR
jgi:DNA-binding XRE family transcriptional regulator